MNTSKTIAGLFLLFTFGSIKETVRICTSMDKGISDNKTFLIPMALIITSVFIGASIYFWRKSKSKF